jgi:hypothetical protein
MPCDSRSRTTSSWMRCKVSVELESDVLNWETLHRFPAPHGASVV